MKSITLAAEFIYLATSVECAGLINQPTAAKGLILEYIDVVIHCVILHFTTLLF